MTSRGFDSAMARERVEIARLAATGPTACWLWPGPVNKVTGYGIQGGHPAHRVSYRLLVGPIPDGLTLDHLCCVKTCVNPGHLEPVTQAENTQRACIRDTCKRGHDRWTLTANGSRACLDCRAANQLRYYRRKQERGEVPPPKVPATHCKHGHEFTEANTYWHQGRRQCRRCNSLRNTAAKSAARMQKRMAAA